MAFSKYLQGFIIMTDSITIGIVSEAYIRLRGLN